MKKILVSLSFVTLLIIAGCTRGSDYDIDYTCASDYDGAKLYVLNWGEYMDPDLIDAFEKACNAEVVYEEADSSEMMESRLTKGSTNYDILIPSDYMIEKLISEDLLQTIDFNNVPNYEHINATYKNRAHDPNNEYSVPYFWGTFGIMYHKEKIEELGLQESDFNTWDVLTNPKLKDHLTLYNSQRDMFMVGFKMLDENPSVNLTVKEGQSVSEAEAAYIELIRQAEVKLGQVNANAINYLTDQIKKDIANGDTAVGLVFNGDFLDMVNELGEDALDTIGYSIPQEGTNMWVDGMIIPKKSQNKRLAEEFINFFLDPKVAYYNAAWVGYSTPHTEALNALREDEDYADLVNLEAYQPGEAVLGRLEVYRNLGSRLNSEINQAFTRVRSK